MVLCFIKQAVITSSQYWIMNTLLWALWFPSRGCCPCWSYTHSDAHSRKLQDPMWHFPNGGCSLPLLCLGIFFPCQLRAQHVAGWPREAGGMHGPGGVGQPGGSSSASLQSIPALLLQWLQVHNTFKSVYAIWEWVWSKTSWYWEYVAKMWQKWNLWIKFPIQLTIHQCWDLRRGHSSIFLSPGVLLLGQTGMGAAESVLVLGAE